MQNGITPATYAVHETDVLMAGNWTVSAYGPIDHGGVDGVRRALETAMSVGSSARLGLVPDTRSRNWVFSPDRVLGAVREAPALNSEDYDQAMVRALGDRDPSSPISITVAGDHAIVYLDHGVGDGQMTLNLSELLSSASARAGVVPKWTANTAEQRPLLRAGLGWYREDPRRLLALRSRAAQGSAPAGAATVPWTPSVASVYAHSSEHYPDELQAWRKKNRPKASLSALFFAALTRAFREENLDIDNTVKVLFNVRRYLKPADTSLANLSAGIDLPLVDAGDIEEISEAISTATASGRPIANLAAASIKSKIARRRGLTAPNPGSVAASGPIRLTLTDMGPIDRTHNIQRLQGSSFDYAAMVSPAGPRYVTLAIGRTPAFNVTASFHDNIVDSAAIRRALERVCNGAIELLEKPSGH